jgi:uncharacterized phage protein (predicted DNA packaging)
MLETIKDVLRVSGTDFDTEISDLISAARSDLILSGVLSAKANSDTDPLIKRAVSTYCKANFGWDNPESERFQFAYDLLKKHLCLSSEYTVAGV